MNISLLSPLSLKCYHEMYAYQKTLAALLVARGVSEQKDTEINIQVSFLTYCKCERLSLEMQLDQALTLDPLSLIPDSQIIYEEQDIYRQYTKGLSLAMFIKQCSYSYFCLDIK